MARQRAAWPAARLAEELQPRAGPHWQRALLRPAKLEAWPTAGGTTGAFGGITTTAGGRRAATEAGVTNLGAGGSGAAGLGGTGLGGAGATSSFSFPGFKRGRGFHGRSHGRFRQRARHRVFGGFFLLRDRTQNIARAGDMREIDLGFYFVRSMSGGCARRPCGSRSSIGAGAKMLANEFGFVFFQRTRVRLLLGNTHRGQHVKNLFALDFQLTGQIIDSNLHPLSFSFSGPAVDYYARIFNLTESLSISVRAWQSSRIRSG